MTCWVLASDTGEKRFECSQGVSENQGSAHILYLESHACFGYVAATTSWDFGMLTEHERDTLLSIAREAIAASLDRRPIPQGGPLTGRLGEPGGAFVTIRLHGELRGCIGYIESELPLCAVIAQVAAKAATDDPRFPPLTRWEFEQSVLEVSLLSPLQALHDTDKVSVGEHGLLIELGLHRGLLLPQVAVENHWDREEFLKNTARKAGLPASAWRDPRAKLYVFTAEVIHEVAVE
jgi:AmmeMemoRadiSam system protein A